MTTTTMSANPFDEPKGSAASPAEASSLRGGVRPKKVAKKRGRPAKLKVSESRDSVSPLGTEVDAHSSSSSLKKTSHAGRVAAASGSLSQNPRRQRQSSLVAQTKIRDLYDDDVMVEGGRVNDPVSDCEDDD